MGRQNHELRKGIVATIEALQGILKENTRGGARESGCVRDAI